MAGSTLSNRPVEDMILAGRRLCVAERELIDSRLREDVSLREIAVELGRAPSTVAREVNAASGRHGYVAGRAQRAAEMRALRPKTPLLVADRGLAGLVAGKQALRWGPAAISAWLAGPDSPTCRTISAETIYQAVFANGTRGLAVGAYKLLPSRQRRRLSRDARKARSGRPGPLGAFKPVAARPAVTRDRVQPGHWEGDLIIGANNRSALAVLVERMSRYTLLVGLPLGYRAADLLTGLQARLRSIVPDLRRTLTWDQGSEMAAWPDLERLTGLDCYFCQPHSPWQKGTVENTNRILRRHLPRGLDLARVPTSQLRQIETNLNTMPRRLHQWRTAHDLLSPHLVATAA